MKKYHAQIAKRMAKFVGASDTGVDQRLIFVMAGGLFARALRC